MDLARVPLEQVTEEHLQELVTLEVMENERLDYKARLPDPGSERREKDQLDFLRDVTAFANAAGGHLVFGVPEDRKRSGVPLRLAGIGPDVDIDRARSRLEKMIGYGIEPRVPGLRVRAVPIRGGEDAIILVRVPASWAGPHWVCFQRDHVFHARGASGKDRMSIDQVRNAFFRSAGARESVKEWQEFRLGEISAGRTAVRLEKGAKLVLHILPLQLQETRADLARIESGSDAPADMLLFREGIRDPCWNFDGLLAADDVGHGESSRYTQVFRNGAFEAVTTQGFGTHVASSRTFNVFYPRGVEKDVFQLARHLVRTGVEDLDIELPIFVSFALVGAKGFVNHEFFTGAVQRNTLDVPKGVLRLPEVMVEELDQLESASYLKAAFDTMWQATGFSRSLSWGPDGIWNPERRPRSS